MFGSKPLILNRPLGLDSGAFAEESLARDGVSYYSLYESVNLIAILAGGLPFLQHKVLEQGASGAFKERLVLDPIIGISLLPLLGRLSELDVDAYPAVQLRLESHEEEWPLEYFLATSSIFLSALNHHLPWILCMAVIELLARLQRIP